MRKKLIVLSAIFGLLAASGVASAATEEEDTTFNFGYDEENGVFVWGTSDSDGLYDCTLENGELDATYTRVPEGILVDDLQENGETIELQPNEDNEEAEGLDPVAYPGVDDECAVSGDFVAGPEGQINHGMFLRLFNLMYSGPGRGCLVRHIAQSDLGKGDQQVNVPDVDPDAEEPGDTFEGTIEFETVLADCEHGVNGEEIAAENRPQIFGSDSENPGPPEHAGKPDDVGPPADAGGNSASAPGRNP